LRTGIDLRDQADLVPARSVTIGSWFSDCISASSLARRSRIMRVASHQIEVISTHRKIGHFVSITHCPRPRQSSLLPGTSLVLSTLFILRWFSRVGVDGQFGMVGKKTWGHFWDTAALHPPFLSLQQPMTIDVQMSQTRQAARCTTLKTMTRT
jgi:hypothetical protein